ncbi:MAG: hypothetical protein Fur0014_05700 [Rubrivivax sp.]
MSVPSPCINVCQMDPASGWCRGCRRTLAEIAAWGSMDDEAKRAVWAQLPARRASAAGASSGIMAAWPSDPPASPR